MLGKTKLTVSVLICESVFLKRKQTLTWILQFVNNVFRSLILFGTVHTAPTQSTSSALCPSNIVDIINLNVLCYWHAHQKLSCVLSSFRLFFLLSQSPPAALPSTISLI